MSEKHSPLPWALYSDRGDIKSACKGFPEIPVAKVLGQETSEERAANAALIVRAVNGLPEAIAALEAMLDEYDRNVCEHEITTRGGHIWTICEGCGRKWADDEGGFVPHSDPPHVVEARATLTKLKG